MRRAALVATLLAAGLVLGWVSRRPAPVPVEEPSAEAVARGDYLKAADDLFRGHFLAGRLPDDWNETTRGRHRIPHLVRISPTLLAPVAELKWKRYLATLSAWLAALEEPGGRPEATARTGSEAARILHQSAHFLVGHVLVDYKTLHEVATNSLKYPAWEISDRSRAEVAPEVKRIWPALKAEGEVFVAHRLRSPRPAPHLLVLEARMAALIRSPQADRVIARLVERITESPADPAASLYFEHLGDLLEVTEDGAALPCAVRGARLDALLPFCREPAPGPANPGRVAGILLRESVRLAMLCGRDTTPTDFARIDTLIDRVAGLPPSPDLCERLVGVLGQVQDDGYAISGDGAMPGLAPRIERIRRLERALATSLSR